MALFYSEIDWLMDSYTLIVIIFMLALLGFQFFLSNKRKKMTEVVQSNVVVGARVMTFSGIVGEIQAINEDIVSLKTGNAVIEVKKGSIREALAAPMVKSDVVETASSVKKPAVKKTAE